MKQLEYPFDANYILNRRKKLKKEFLEAGTSFVEKNIAILGGSTTNGIRDMLELFLLNQGIKPSFYESGYDRYYEEAVFPNTELETFRPDIIYIHTTNRNIMVYPSLADDTEAVNDLIQNETEKFEEVWSHLFQAYQCPVIQNNFEMPLYRLLGNKDSSDIHGAVNFLSRLNMRFYEYAQTHENFFICDINYLSADYGLREWSDPLYFYLYKYALNVQAIPSLAFNVANIIKSIFGKNKKGFVLDLDNTLWGGMIGDVGAEHIMLGVEEPAGQMYLEFQKYVKAHKQLGGILNIVSKNDYETAISGLRHPQSELKPEDFIEIRANWDTKDKNFSDIMTELNLLPESLVFIDDNPAERHLVTEQIPGVTAPEIGEPHQYILNIDRNGFFEVTSLSDDDRDRNKMYKENAQRAQIQSAFACYGEYLQSLCMKAVIRPFEPAYISRILQLTNKSNQFNLTTKRYTQNEIEKMAADPDYITLYGKLEDKFGDQGVVSVVIGHIEEQSCHVELWLMSCRAVKRNMEYAMMDALVQRCQERGIRTIRGYYYPTEKNGMVRDFYHLQGFDMVYENGNGATEWLYRIEDFYTKKNRFIYVEE